MPKHYIILLNAALAALTLALCGVDGALGQIIAAFLLLSFVLMLLALRGDRPPPVAIARSDQESLTGPS